MIIRIMSLYVLGVLYDYKKCVCIVDKTIYWNNIRVYRTTTYIKEKNS